MNDSQGTTPVTIYDFVLLLLVQSVQKELEEFKKHGRQDSCKAINTLLNAAAKNAPHIYPIAHAVFEAADIYRRLKHGITQSSGRHQMGKFSTNWNLWRKVR